MAEQTNHDAVEEHYESEDNSVPEDHAENDVRVVYVRRKGVLSRFQDVRAGIRNAGRRWIEFSVDRPLKHQDKLPAWVDTRRGRWILTCAVLGMLSLWVVIFGLAS